MGKNHAMERVEVRLHPFLTSAEDPSVPIGNDVAGMNVTAKKKIPACAYLPFRECCTTDRRQVPVG
jgi:hypothetical protein